MAKRILAARVASALSNLAIWRGHARLQAATHLFPMLALIERGAGEAPEKPIIMNETPHEFDFWDRYFRLDDGNPEKPYFNPITQRRAEEATGALGHGAALKYPDFPYLKWSFSYDHSPDGSPRTSERNNVETFLRACERLYERFRGLGENHRDPEFNVGQGFESFREAFKSVLEVRETDRDRRCELWRSAAMSGDLFGEPEEIPRYEGELWQESLNDLSGSTDSRLALQTPAFQFLRAAAIYRTYVLRNLLPSHNLILD